jgi:excisionase family DNA binding protein
MAKLSGQSEEVLLTARQVAGLLQVHVTTVRRWSNSDGLKSYRMGNRGHRRYRMKDVEGFLSTENTNGILPKIQ